MNVQTMQLDPRVAKIHYQDYHRRVLEHRAERRRIIAAKGHDIGAEIRKARIERTRLEREDEELMRAYKAMADGARVLNLPHVLSRAGVQSKTHLPALAIAGADWKECHFRIERGLGVFSESSFGLPGWKIPKSWRGVRVLQTTFPAETFNTHWRSQNNLAPYPVKALVPAIPAHLRPSSLEGIYILWEAVWTPAAPVDPLLLKRVSETIFVVLAQWDLTPLEQSILEGRLA